MFSDHKMANAQLHELALQEIALHCFPWGPYSAEEAILIRRFRHVSAADEVANNVLDPDVATPQTLDII